MTWLLTFLTAAAAVVFCVWSGDGRVYRLEPELDGQGLEKPLDRFFRPGRMTRRDWLLAAILAGVFLVVDLIGLGDTKGIESWHTFSVGESVTMELDRPSAVSRIQYYSGPTVGSYVFSWSSDGVNWETETVEQNYVQVLKWGEFVPEEPLQSVRWFRVTGAAEGVILGEIALRAEDEELLYTVGGEELTDEQGNVPRESSFRNSSYFDEIYHVRTAWEHLTGHAVYEDTHPPLGKLIIGLGIRLFGMTPFGWRFMGVLFGALMLPGLYFLLKRMTDSTRAAFCAAAIYGLDFMHYAQTRLATIDTYGVFFTLMMYLFFFEYFIQPFTAPLKKTMPLLGLSGLGFALGAAAKWTCVFGGAGLALLWVVRQLLQLRWEKQRNLGDHWRSWLPATVGWSCVFFLLLPLLAYLLSYIPYAKPAQVSVFSVDYLKLVADNVNFMYSYHSELEATHPYQSDWWMWVLDVRPILYYLHYFTEDHSVRSAFAAWGNPLMWWTGLGAMFILAWKAVRGDRMSWFVLAGYLSTLLPWVLVKRCAFIYHYFPCTLFLILGIGRLFADQERRVRKAWAAPAMLCGCLVLFILFYPVMSGVTYTSDYGNAVLRWFAGMWPF